MSNSSSNRHNARNITMLGYYGANNIGDEIMLFFLLKKIADIGTSFTAISEDPTVTRQQFGINCVLNKPLFLEWGGPRNFLSSNYYKLLWTLLRTDLLVVGGGDLIRDDQGWETFSYTVGKILLAMLFGSEVYLLNVGIGRPVTWYGKYFLRFIVQRVRLIVVRDKRSVKVCQELGVNRKKIHKCLDIAISIRNEPLPDPQIPWKDEKIMIVSLRKNSNAYGQYPLTRERKKNLAQSLDTLISSQNFKIIFLPFQNSEYSRDKQLHDEIMSLQRYHNDTLSLEWIPEFFQVAAIIKKAKVVLGMRLHSIVLATAFDVPTIAMPYDNKITEYCNDVGIQHLLFPKILDKREKIISLLQQAIDLSGPYNTENSWDTIMIPPV